MQPRPNSTYGRTKDQAKDSIREAAAQIGELAARLGVPVVSEKLDFSKKKSALKGSDDARYARMLSSFAYSAFDAALAAAATIARRAMGFSERLPRSNDGTVTVPDERLCPCHPRPTREEWFEACMDGMERTEPRLPEEGACSAEIVGTKVQTRTATQDVGRAERRTAPWSHGGGGTFPPEAASVTRPRGWPRARKPFLK